MIFAQPISILKSIKAAYDCVVLAVQRSCTPNLLLVNASEWSLSLSSLSFCHSPAFYKVKAALRAGGSSSTPPGYDAFILFKSIPRGCLKTKLGGVNFTSARAYTCLVKLLEGEN